MHPESLLDQLLNLSGPAFLKFYLVLGGCVLAASLLARHVIRLPLDPLRAIPPLDPFDVAYLRGREPRAVEAAVAALVKERLLTVSPQTGKVHATAILVGNPSPVVAAVHAKVLGRGARGLPIRSVLSARPRGVFGRTREKLSAYGLLTDWGTGLAVRATTALLMFGVAALGIAKVQVGLVRGRPVEFLVVLTAGTVFAGLVFLFSGPHRSRRGDAVLKGLEGECAALRSVAQSGGALQTSDVTLAAALFGVGALATPGLEDLLAARQRHVGPGGSGCGGTGCGGSSCGGGCGGGGCGGCGG